MIEPTAEECNPCHFNVDSKCYKPCNHIKSEFARLEKENSEFKEACICAIMNMHVSTNLDRKVMVKIERALQNAKS